MVMLLPKRENKLNSCIFAPQNVITPVCLGRVEYIDRYKTVPVIPNPNVEMRKYSVGLQSFKVVIFEVILSGSGP